MVREHVASVSRTYRHAGFTYAFIMLGLAMTVVVLAAAQPLWHTTVRRAKEAQLAFIGGEFKRAIESYYHASPGGAKQLPARLEDLLLDRRYPTVRRHLRKIYADPITGRPEWGLVRTPAGIKGVFSLSPLEPIRGRATAAQAAADAKDAALPRARTYAELKFTADVADTPAPAPGSPGAEAKQEGASTGPLPGSMGEAGLTGPDGRPGTTYDNEGRQ